MKRTKIVATIGPVSETTQMIEEFIRTGVNVFRFNMKHADHQWHNERILRVRQVSQRINVPVGILIDLQGPEVRIETFQKKDLSVKAGDHITFSLSPIDQNSITIPTPEVFPAIKQGMLLLIDDGNAEFEITQASDTSFIAKALQDSTIKHRKSVNFPGANIELPSLTSDDYAKLDMDALKEVDLVALSFTRTKEDIRILRAELDKRSSTALICAKIENQMALDYLEEIIQAADVIMVARGDLAVEVAFERLAFEQKRIIQLSRSYAKPVITATQMLQSMVANMRPTRAEITDVSNAIYDGTDALMLSEETAGGQFPLQAVRVMAKIAEFIETVATPPLVSFNSNESTNIAIALKEKIEGLAQLPEAILVPSSKVLDVFSLSELRSMLPMYVESENIRQVQSLSVVYGVIALLGEKQDFEQQLKTKGLLGKQQTVLVY